MEINGHTYFGQWFPRYDPKLHDSITGPVEDYAPLNYAESTPGETFVKIGIGVLKRVDEPKSGFAYVYTKTVRLTPGKPQMTIDHTLKNTGTKAIETNVYNHGFFMLDSQPTAPTSR